MVCGLRVAWLLFPCRGWLRVVLPCPGLRHQVAVVAWYLSVCLGCGRRRASLACLVAPRPCAAPSPVWSFSVLPSAFPTQWCLSPSRGLAPPDLLGGCASHVEAGRKPRSLCLPPAPAEAGALGSLWVVPVRGPAIELSLEGLSGICLGLRALRWFACVNQVTDASRFPYGPSFDWGLGRCTGAVSCGRRQRPFRVGGRHARVPCVCACACPSWPDRVGRPPGRVSVRLTFSLGRSRCALCLLGPLRAWVALFVVVAVIFFLSSFAPPLSLAIRVFPSGLPWALASCGPPARPPSFVFFPLSPPPHSSPPPFFALLLLFVCFLFFRFLFFCRGVPVVRCFGSFVYPGLWGMLVHVAVGIVPRRGRVCACARCVVWCSLVVPVFCVLLPVVLRLSGCPVLAAFLFPVLPLVPSLCALSSGLVLRRLRPVVALRDAGANSCKFAEFEFGANSGELLDPLEFEFAV